MIYNSEIIILNDTPERGTVTGKRMRLTGTQGKLYAKTIDKIYKFGRWESPDGQVISTSNPLIINDWQHQFIRVVFEHVLLSDQMFAERDAIATQTNMLEKVGIETSPYDAVHKYYSQKNIAGPATRTTTYGVTFPTGNKTYGYRSDDATWDPTGEPAHVSYRGSVTGTWYQKPDRTDFYPASGVPAEQFNRGHTAKFRRRHPRRQRIFAGLSSSLYYWGLEDSSLAAGSWEGSHFGAYNNPSVGTPSLYPMYDWLPVPHLYKNIGLEPIDLTGMETSDVYNLHFTSYYHGRLMYNNVHDIDAASEMPIKYLGADHNRGLIPGRGEYANWHPNDTNPYVHHGVNPTKHDTSTISKFSPRLLEPLGYTSINTFHLRSQYHFRESYDFSGPQDTTRDDSTGKERSNPHWVKKWQFVPHSGSLLWSFRYTPLEDFRVGQSSHISDFSSFKHYFKNLKHVAMYQPNWDNYGNKKWAGQSLPDCAGLKNLKSIAWYENYNHTSFNTDEPFDWSGLKDMTNLRSLYIQHSYDTYTKYLNLADIPSSVVDLYIQPTAYLFNEQFPEETTRHKLSIDSAQVVDKSKYKNNNDITITTLNIISTS